jgi:hypothetical protein
MHNRPLQILQDLAGCTARLSHLQAPAVRTCTLKLAMSPCTVVRPAAPAAAALSAAYCSMWALLSSAQACTPRLASCMAWLAGPQPNSSTVRSLPPGWECCW